VRLGPREQSNYHVLAKAIPRHIEAAREAAMATRSLNKFRVFRNALLFERAMTNLDAAEAHIRKPPCDGEGHGRTSAAHAGQPVPAPAARLTRVSAP
jgi:hypothetical protein